MNAKKGPFHNIESKIQYIFKSTVSFVVFIYTIAQKKKNQVHLVVLLFNFIMEFTKKMFHINVHCKSFWISIELMACQSCFLLLKLMLRSIQMDKKHTNFRLFRGTSDSCGSNNRIELYSNWHSFCIWTNGFSSASTSIIINCDRNCIVRIKRCEYFW